MYNTWTYVTVRNRYHPGGTVERPHVGLGTGTVMLRKIRAGPRLRRASVYFDFPPRTLRKQPFSSTTLSRRGSPRFSRSETWTVKSCTTTSSTRRNPPEQTRSRDRKSIFLGTVVISRLTPAEVQRWPPTHIHFKALRARVIQSPIP